MNQSKNLTVKLSQFDKLKSTKKKKNATDVILKLKSNMLGNSYDETNFPYKLLLTDRQVSKICQYFANN